MLDIEKPIVTTDGRPATILNRDVPGDKPFLVSFEHEMTGELTSGTFNHRQLQDSFKNAVVPEVFTFAIVLEAGVPVLVASRDASEHLEGVHLVSLTMLGEQPSAIGLIKGTKPWPEGGEGWDQIEGGLEAGQVPNAEHPTLANGSEQSAMQTIDVIVRTPPSDDVANDDVW